MTLEEAIKINKDYKGILDKLPTVTNIQQAIQLGIEALELYFGLRGCTAIDVEDIPTHLPSETE